jgi:hypothetical protein
MHSLLTSVPHHKAATIHLIHIIFASLLEASAALSTDTLNGHLTSTINTLMAPAYHSASALLSFSPPPTKLDALTLTPPHSPSPSLIDQQRKDLVTSHIASARIFSRLSCVVEKAHRGIVREAFADLSEGVGRVVHAFVRDFGLVVGDGRGIEKRGDGDTYGEFRVGLEAWVVRAEGVVEEVGIVVGEVRRAYMVLHEEDGLANEDGGEVERFA